MTAAGEPLRLYPTRRDRAPRPGDPEWVRAKDVEKRRAELLREAKQRVGRLQRALDDIEVLDRDGYLEVGFERFLLHLEHAVQATFELEGELGELVDERDTSNEAKAVGWDDAISWARHNRDHCNRDVLDRPFNPHRPEGYSPALVDEQPDEPNDPAACTCGHPECGAC